MLVDSAKPQYSVDRRHFIDGSDARIISGSAQGGLFGQREDKRSEVKPVDLSGNLIVPLSETTPRPTWAAHAEFVAALAEHPPLPIPVDADRLNMLLTALAAYPTATLDDTAQNVPGGFDLRQIDPLVCDLRSEVAGVVQATADALPRRWP